MASYELQKPPKHKRALELWLQHAAGHIIFEDIRAYAIDRIDPALSAKARSAAIKGINDAVYGLMMVIDGVSGDLRNSRQLVDLSMSVKLVNQKSEKVAAALDLRNGDGMCMGYHYWLEGDFGKDPIAVVKPAS